MWANMHTDPKKKLKCEIRHLRRWLGAVAMYAKYYIYIYCILNQKMHLKKPTQHLVGRSILSRRVERDAILSSAWNCVKSSPDLCRHPRANEGGWFEPALGGGDGALGCFFFFKKKLPGWVGFGLKENCLVIKAHTQNGKENKGPKTKPKTKQKSKTTTNDNNAIGLS